MATRNKLVIKPGNKFCSLDERRITTLGTGYVANFISGEGAEKVGATLTDRRIYFSGEAYSIDDKGGLSSVEQEKIVSVRDVTGVGYTKYKPTSLVIYGSVAIVSAIISYPVLEMESVVLDV